MRHPERAMVLSTIEISFDQSEEKKKECNHNDIGVDCIFIKASSTVQHPLTLSADNEIIMGA